MPASVVKTSRDERLWSEAKKQAADQGREGDYKYIMGIFMRMKERKDGADPKTAAGTLRKAETQSPSPPPRPAGKTRGSPQPGRRQTPQPYGPGPYQEAPRGKIRGGGSTGQLQGEEKRNLGITGRAEYLRKNLRITGMAKAALHTAAQKPRPKTQFAMPADSSYTRPAAGGLKRQVGARKRPGGGETRPGLGKPATGRWQFTRPKKIGVESFARSMAKACVIRKAGDGGKHSKCASCKMGKACKADMLKQSMAEYGTKAVGSAKHTLAPSAPPAPPRKRGTQFAGRGGYEAQARPKATYHRPDPGAPGTGGKWRGNPTRPSSSVVGKPNPGSRTWFKKSLLDSNLAKLGPVRIKAQTFADFFKAKGGVKAHTRKVGGKPVQVKQHTRKTTAGGKESDDAWATYLEKQKKGTLKNPWADLPYGVHDACGWPAIDHHGGMCPPVRLHRDVE